MSKTDHLFRRTTNEILRYIADHVPVGAPAPTENFLAAHCGVSRSPVRTALAHLGERGIIGGGGQARIVARHPRAEDYFDDVAMGPRADHIEKVFMDLVLRQELLPGQRFSEAELARRAGSSTTAVREFLIGFARSGLIAKKPQGSWRLQAFDRRFATELADMRDMLETQAVTRFAGLGPDDPAWAAIGGLIARHRALLAALAGGTGHYKDFSALDRDFHNIIINAMDNRFVREFYDVVSFVFHYHYQWERKGERARNIVALEEHLRILEALDRRDAPEAARRLAEHLATARSTLLDSIEGMGEGIGEEPEEDGHERPVVSRPLMASR
ncbi:GntR family transcriptional regulator [Azospirillum sp. SYSU D00513]|uniref:GntR family transcriptional regulator n=1 Tax=Azospirillum sp. SYSU D00513 TaxID=2812561 RepID=UPI001A96B6B3|nr:GntR family transcriptional regulator [Azospirillum sp. SYSU D00513]